MLLSAPPHLIQSRCPASPYGSATQTALIPLGKGGGSTVVKYNEKGAVLHTYSLAGSVDGLKVDPATGTVWALQNQDGNSTLSLIQANSGKITGPIGYAVKSPAQGYDDVAFLAGQVFESYTNPASPSDPTIVQVQPGTNPIAVTPILLEGATGTDLTTGLANQPITQNDPDSLKVTGYGDLVLTSGDDGELIFVKQPGTCKQAVSFVKLRDAAGKAVSGLDDSVFATTREGTFYLTETGANQVLKIKATHLKPGTLFASVGSLHALVSVDTKTGIATPVISNLKGPHGLEFVPDRWRRITAFRRNEFCAEK